MKFTHQLKFNCVPEWKEHYINYTVLKKIIYHIAAIESKEAAEGLSDEEARHLLGKDGGPTAQSRPRFRGSREDFAPA